MKLFEDTFLIGSGNIGLSSHFDCHVYMVDCMGQLVLIDAGSGMNNEKIVANIQSLGYSYDKISHILLTHAHADHAGGARGLKELTKAEIVTSPEEAQLLQQGSDEELGLVQAKNSGGYPMDYVYSHCQADIILSDEEEISIGEYTFKTFCIKGHSPGSSCYYVHGRDAFMLFVGDVVFFNGILGFTNCYGSSLSEYRVNFPKLTGLKIDALFPGHLTFILNGGSYHLDKAQKALQESYAPTTISKALL